MVETFSKLFHRRRRRPNQGRKERRSTRFLIEGATRLLARHDYDQISVARFATEANCAVGTFYLRFPNKVEFLDAVINATLRDATEAAKEELATETMGRVAIHRVLLKLVDEVVNRLSEPQTAGIVRAALKLGTTMSAALGPLREYRSTVTERANMLLASRLDIENPSRAVSEVMQIVIATVLDTVTHSDGPLRPGTRRLTNSLFKVAVRHLGLGYRSEWENERPIAASEDDVTAKGKEESVVAPVTPSADLAAKKTNIQAHLASTRGSKPEHKSTPRQILAGKTKSNLSRIKRPRRTNKTEVSPTRTLIDQARRIRSGQSGK